MESNFSCLLIYEGEKYASIHFCNSIIYTISKIKKIITVSIHMHNTKFDFVILSL